MSDERNGKMEQIEVRPDRLIEVLSMAVLHCRSEMKTLANDSAAVLDDVDEYLRLLRIMCVALNILDAVADFPSTRLVKISGDGGQCEEGITIERK